MLHPWLVRLGVFCFAGVLVLRGNAFAQERIYVAQSNPAGLEAFSFNGSQIVREGRLSGSLEISGLAVTDKFFALGVDLYSAGGIQLPSISGVGGGRVLIPTPDNRRVLFVGSNGPVPTVSVVDLDPSSATFRTRLGSSVVLADAGFEAIAAELSPDGNRLYVALNGAADAHRVVTVDVSNAGGTPPTLTRLPNTQPVGSVMTGIHRFGVGGAPYLAVGVTGRFLYWALDASGTPLGTTPVELPLGISAGSTLVRDFVVNDGAEIAYAIVDENGVGPTVGPVDSTLREAVYVFTITRDAEGALHFIKQPEETSLTAHGLIPSGDIDRLFLSQDGRFLFVVDHGRFALTSAHVAVLALDSAPPRVLDTEPLDPTPGFHAQAVAALVAEPPEVVPGAPIINEVSVDGVPDTVLVNSTTHTIRITGRGFSEVRHVGLRTCCLRTLTGASQSDTEIVLTTTSPLAPAAGRQPITLIASTGAVTRSFLTVANGPTLQAPYLVLADDPAINRMRLLHAATKTEVTGEFMTGAGATELLVSPDGRLLFAADFRDDSVSVHALTPDAFPGAQFFERREARIARNPIQMVADWTRNRLFVGTFADKRISVIDIDPGSPDFPTEIAQYFSPGEPSNQRETLAGIRGLALSADGRYLYAARGGTPWLLVIDTLTSPPTVLECSGIFGESPPTAPIRIDGLAFAANDTRLLLSASSDAFVRVLSVTPGQCPSGLAGTLTLSGAGFSRRILVHPDQRVFVVDGNQIRVFAGVSDPITAESFRTIPLVGNGGRPALTPDGAYLFVPASGSITTIDLRTHIDGIDNPSRYTPIARTFAASSSVTTAVSPGLLTPAGVNVTIRPLPDVEITFPEVRAAGHTTVTAANVSHLPVSSIFRLDRIPVFYEIKTSANWMAGGPARVCLTYDDEGVLPEDEALLKLLHEENGTTVDRTVSVDVTTNVICADVPNFSQVVPVTAKRTPVITWNQPAPIAEGTALTWIQLNASANTGGSFDYSPSNGAVLDAGVHTLTTHFTPVDTSLYHDATASVEISVQAVAGRMSGGGFTEAGDARHYFEFDVVQDAAGIEAGMFQLHHHAGHGAAQAINRFRAGVITRLIFSDDGVVFNGTGTWNGAAGYVFNVRAVDLGEPGDHDQVSITITSPNGLTVASVEGVLAGGNLQRR